VKVTPTWEMLILGGTVLTMEPDCEPIEGGAVAISDGRIAALGPAEELLDLAPTGEVVDASGCLVLPGLVNTHSHLAMSLMRGLADDIPLRQWLEERVWPAERSHITPDTIRIGTQLAAAEQLLAGITTTADMYFFADEVASALAEAGMRAVVAETLMGTSTPSCASVQDMLSRQRELVDRFEGHPLITPSVAPHAPYSVSASDLVVEAEMADEHEIPMQIHLAETRWEAEKILADKGVSPVAYLGDLGVLSDRTVAAHCVHVSAEDIQLLAEFDVGVAHNPVSNLKLASGVAPVPAMLEAGVTLGLGTDGAASNNTLDLIRDLQLAALLHKGQSGDPSVLPARRLAALATREGARVLGLDDRVGVLAVGREADLICLSTAGAHCTPMYDPFSHLAFAARSSDVRHVVVRGRVLVRNRQLETLDLEAIRHRAVEIAERIRG